MSDLPPVKYLDMAAKAMAMPDWRYLDAIDCGYRGELRDGAIAHARTLQEADALREKLAQHEPEPVDADEAALVRILNALYDFKAGSLDAYGGDTKAALAQYKAERSSLPDDEALLIAREICARVADTFDDQHYTATGYRKGYYDRYARVQFTLSMLKRDPAALEAFRGVGRG